jgi:cytochrome P450
MLLGVSALAALPPGPRAPRVVQAVLWGLRYPQFTRAAREKFGSTYTVRPGTMPPFVLTTDPEAVRLLLTGDPMERRQQNDVVRPVIGDGAVILIDGAEHLARRKLLLPPFHGERVQVYAALMQRLMDEEVSRWRPGDVVRMLPIAQNVTIEVILQAVLGVSDERERREFRTTIDNLLFYPFGARGLRAGERAPNLPLPAGLRGVAAFLASLPTPAVFTYFPNLKRRSRLIPTTIPWWRHHDRLHALLDRHVAATRADPRLDERDDVLAMLLRADLGISTEALREDLITLITAGHETTAAAIAWGTVLLAHDDEVRARAATAARDGDDAYLGALAKEILRIRPPLPAAALRVLDEDVEIDGHHVPAGTPIGIDGWGLHHDPARHPEPDRLDPERFLGGGAASYTWLPFGGGARRCLGAALAELEIKVALRSILCAVDVTPADRELAPPARRGLVIVPQGGGRVRVGQACGAPDGAPHGVT